MHINMTMRIGDMPHLQAVAKDMLASWPAVRAGTNAIAMIRWWSSRTDALTAAARSAASLRSSTPGACWWLP